VKAAGADAKPVSLRCLRSRNEQFQEETMADEKLRVVEAVQGYLDAYSRKDVDGCVGFVAERTPVLLLGTNDDEIVTDRETFATS